MGSATTFGTLPDGQEVKRITISAGGLSASILTYGAVLQDLRLAGHAPPLVLGFEQLDHYLTQSVYHGAIVGRFANRIAQGRFALDGKLHSLQPNDRGHLLHGGWVGVDIQNWAIEGAGSDFVRLRLLDAAREGGFPGNVEVSCTYRLRASATLCVDIEATTDAATPCSFAHHSWFNLDDGGAVDILGHRLRVAAETYLPLTPEGAPTGEVAPVDGTPFDFRRLRPIGGSGYDQNICLALARRSLSLVAELHAAKSGIAMDLWTTEPGLQFFDGGVPARQVPGLDGIHYGRHAGLCLEPQAWPDAPNRSAFPNAILRPGEVYRQQTEYRFRRSALQGDGTY